MFFSWYCIMLKKLFTQQCVETSVLKAFKDIGMALCQATRLNRLTRIVRVAALMPRQLDVTDALVIQMLPFKSMDFTEKLRSSLKFLDD